MKLLKSVGISPTIMVSTIDEDVAVLEKKWTTPADIALGLAILKAEDVVNRDLATPAIVIGCDSVMEQSGIPLGKPEDTRIAKKRLQALSGSFGTLHTGHCVIYCSGNNNVMISRLVSTDVYFHDLTEAEIDAYIETGEPLRVAGSFTLDALGAPFIKSISGEASNVVGLSLPTLRLILQELGFGWDQVLAQVTAE
jgi:septum formation protein